MKFWTLPAILQRLYNYFSQFVTGKKVQNKRQQNKSAKKTGTQQSKLNVKVYKFVNSEISDSLQSSVNSKLRKTKKSIKKNQINRRKRIKPKYLPKICQRQNFESENENIQSQDGNFINQSGQSISPITKDINNSESGESAKSILADFQDLLIIKPQKTQLKQTPTKTKNLLSKPNDYQTQIKVKQKKYQQKHSIFANVNMKKKSIFDQVPIYEAQNQLSQQQIKPPKIRQKQLFTKYYLKQMKIQHVQQTENNSSKKISQKISQEIHQQINEKTKPLRQKGPPIVIVIDQSSENINLNEDSKNNIRQDNVK